MPHGLTDPRGIQFGVMDDMITTLPVLLHRIKTQNPVDRPSLYACGKGDHNPVFGRDGDCLPLFRLAVRMVILYPGFHWRRD
ncbi:hypothetical protein DESC_690015 [Desulfosarcina cetonica]|nr:hypothetical protein DESC_690015 [Desulfosarcina cetonica]